MCFFFLDLQEEMTSEPAEPVMRHFLYFCVCSYSCIAFVIVMCVLPCVLMRLLCTVQAHSYDYRKVVSHL